MERFGPRIALYLRCVYVARLGHAPGLALARVWLTALCAADRIALDALFGATAKRQLKIKTSGY